MIGIVSVLFTGCSEEDDIKLEGSEADLVGLWNISDDNIELDLFVGEQTFVDYLIESEEFSEQEAQAFYDNYLGELIADLDIGGTIEFKSDYTYYSVFPGEDSDSGVWKLSSDGKTLTLDEGDPEYETDIAVNSATDNSMNVSIIEVLDEEGEVLILMKITMQLSK